MSLTSFLILAMGLLACSVLAAADYYVRPSGDDGNAGTSDAQAWKTLQRIKTVPLEPGDRILLEGGAAFEGGLSLTRGGTREKPVTVTSFGEGRATLKAGKGKGISIYNCAGFVISKLKLEGDGRETNTECGISAYNDLAGDVKLEHLQIEDVEVSGFGKTGISIGAHSGKSGFRGVRITRCAAHDNGESGISAWGYCPPEFVGWSHEDIYVGHCKAYNNAGIAAKKDNHSGSGIVIGGVDGALIEHCEAYNNGWLCNYNGGGPVGIWVWDATRAVIQHCESHHNHTGKGSLDGGGFDLDGGVTHSIIQYCYSHDNDGAGYLLAQYKGARPFFKNVIRYNISQNDGRQHGYGGIHVWSHEPRELKDTDFHNNTIFMPRAETGDPAAIKIQNGCDGVRLFNNILVVTGSVPMVSMPALDKRAVTFLGNIYFAAEGAFSAQWGKQSFASLAEWRKASGMERNDEQDTGSDADPRLVDAGKGATVGDTSKLPTMNAYRLRENSPALGTALDILKLFKVAPGKQDFFGAALPEGAALSAGAHQGNK